MQWYVKGQVGKEANNFVGYDTWILGLESLDCPSCVSDFVFLKYIRNVILNEKNIEQFLHSGRKYQEISLEALCFM